MPSAVTPEPPHHAEGSQMPALRHGPLSALTPANSCLKLSKELGGLESVNGKRVAGRRENMILVSKQQ